MRVKEFRELVISALVLALAFGIALSGGFRAFQQPGVLVLVIGMSLVAVSLGFILHELGHRLIARRFGYFAEYSMWPMGLMIALGISLFGFVFAVEQLCCTFPQVDGPLNSGVIHQDVQVFVIVSNPVAEGFAVLLFQ